MIELFKTVIWCITCVTIGGTCTVLWYTLKYIQGAQEIINEEVRRKPILLMGVPDHFKKQEMCEEEVEACPWLLHHVPLRFRTQEMRVKAVENYYPLRFIPDHLKTQDMCKKAIEKYPYNLKDVAEHFKTQEMCDEAVRDDSSSLQFVPDWFVTREGVDMWHDDYYDDDVIGMMIMMKMNFLGSMMDIKNGRHRKP